MKTRKSFIRPLLIISAFLLMLEILSIFYHKYSSLKVSSFFILVIFLWIAFIVVVTLYTKYQRQIAPMDQIAQVAKSVGKGDLTQRVNIKSKGKVGQLGNNINKMIESLQDREEKIIKYQKEIHQQKKYLQALINSLVDGIISINKNCIITGINPIVSIWVGLSEDEIIGKPLFQIIKCDCKINCDSNEINTSMICPYILQNERLLPTEAQIINVISKTEKSLGVSTSQIYEGVEDLTFVIALRDITEFKEINKMRDDFIATLTHDLRVPILAEATTLKFFEKGMFGILTNKQKEAIENMTESNNGLLSLVNSLLDTYKYESGKTELIKEPTNIKKLVQECISELYPISQKNNQKLNDFCSTEIPLINVDKSEIKRVIVNLLNNSLIHTQKGGIINIKAEENNNELIVEVTDNGKGIPDAEINIIFDRFFSTAKKFRKVGTGLGLYLSKQIIEKHNGKIWVESTLGSGSTFFFSLPIE